MASSDAILQKKRDLEYDSIPANKMRALEWLQGYPMTVQLLKETKIANSLTRIIKGVDKSAGGQDPEVIEASRALLDKWKNLAREKGLVAKKDWRPPVNIQPSVSSTSETAASEPAKKEPAIDYESIKICEDITARKKTLEGPFSSMEKLAAMFYLGSVNMKASILKTTQIGPTVRKLAKSEDKELAEKAQELLTQWKALVAAEQSVKPKIKASASSASIGSASSSKEAHPVPPQENGAASSSNGAAGSEDFIHVDSGRDLTYTGNERRDNVRTRLHELLWPRVSIKEQEPALLAELIEKRCMELHWPTAGHGKIFAKTDFKRYMDQIRSISWNLKDPENSEFLEKVKRAHPGFQPADLAKMTAMEMASSKKKAQREEDRKYCMEEIQTDWARKNGAMQISGMFRCGKCKKEKTTYYQMQTRSSDEPMTTFVTCLFCGNRWKFC